MNLVELDRALRKLRQGMAQRVLDGLGDAVRRRYWREADARVLPFEGGQEGIETSCVE